MTADRMNTEVGDDGPNQAQRLLEELYRQRAELGEIAAELISLLQAAGVSVPDDTAERSPD
jgi:hypothetical protein